MRRVIDFFAFGGGGGIPDARLGFGRTFDLVGAVAKPCRARGRRERAAENDDLMRIAPDLASDELVRAGSGPGSRDDGGRQAGLTRARDGCEPSSGTEHVGRFRAWRGDPGARQCGVSELRRRKMARGSATYETRCLERAWIRATEEGLGSEELALPLALLNFPRFPSFPFSLLHLSDFYLSLHPHTSTDTSHHGRRPPQPRTDRVSRRCPHNRSRFVSSSHDVTLPHAS